MADFGDYPPNLPVKDALILRQAQAADHAVVPYTGDDLARPRLGPANPFRDDASTLTSSSSSSLKRKNVLTGLAEETFISEHTFRAKHRAVERAGAGGPQREGMSNREQKEVQKRLRAGRERKGDATIADGDGAYVGPWAKYNRERYEMVEVGEDEELGSDEEYEVVEEDEEEEVVPSGLVVQAPAPALARRKEVEELGEETTTFHGESQYDYLGRTYMHVPQDLDISLTKEVGSVTNFIPKKVLFTWRYHDKPITALQLFPRSSHLGLSGSADGLVKIWDVYRGRELLRTFAGHNKAITDLSFNNEGTKFLSGGFDRRVRLWDTETGQCVNRFNCGKTPHVIKFNPSAENGHEFLAGLSDNRILQYDSRAGNETVQEYDHHLGAINTIEFIDENRRFMSTSDDRSLRVWEYGIPVEIKTIRYVHTLSIYLFQANSSQRTRHVCPHDVRPAPQRQVRPLPVQRQFHRRLLVRLRQVSPASQEVLARPQHGRQRHRAHLQSRRAVCCLGRHGRQRLLLGFQNLQDVQQAHGRQRRRDHQLRRVVRAGDKQGVYGGGQGRDQDVGLSGWDALCGVWVV
jgi:pre-mRNA-processing factor 17